TLDGLDRGAVEDLPRLGAHRDRVADTAVGADLELDVDPALGPPLPRLDRIVGLDPHLGYAVAVGAPGDGQLGGAEAADAAAHARVVHRGGEHGEVGARDDAQLLGRAHVLRLRRWLGLLDLGLYALLLLDVGVLAQAHELDLRGCLDLFERAAPADQRPEQPEQRHRDAPGRDDREGQPTSSQEVPPNRSNHPPEW